MTTTRKEYQIVYEIVALDMDSGITSVIAKYRSREDAATYIEVRRNKRKRGEAVIHGIRRSIKKG